MDKIKRASEIEGPAYVHVMSICPTGWRIPTEEAIKYGRLIVDSCVFPLYEVINGKYRMTYEPEKILPVAEYIKGQGRFRHLTPEMIGEIQAQTTRAYEKILKLCKEECQ
jgi:pyruvate ferredoxin oxidoreductase beta subunit